MNQTYKDGLAIVGPNVVLFALAVVFWAWLWPPGVWIPIAGVAWRIWRAV